MKKIIIIFFILVGQTLGAQDQELKKPAYVIIAANEIITKVELEAYAQQGRIKSMNKGVSEEKRNELASELGEGIGDREFIILVALNAEKQIPVPNKQLQKTEGENLRRENGGLKLKVGDQAADFTVQMINGDKITLSELRGKVVLLNFWATWCGPCLMEFYEIPPKILEPFKNSDFVFLPISRGEKEKLVKAKMLQLKEKGIVFNAGIDPDKKIWNAYATQFIPKNFIIDKNGMIQFISTGNAEGNVDEIALEIERLLAL
ncbi:MAG TPA: TlpA family protein disulfide reductase [Leeuwenhoekiella sp.]|nr:TlpA family protein disulfide reductase [Leeuwenhoekiella sp.]